MSEKKSSPPNKAGGKPYTIVKERLSGSNTDLTSFFFGEGANVYVFSYEKDGVRRHTFVDTPDSVYRNQILSILAENDINPANIERILITHRHPDHCSSAPLLAKESKARILAHSNFKGFVEGELGEVEREWTDKWWGYAPSQFQGLDIEYLFQSGQSARRSINGVDFPILGEPIEIGEGAKLEILAPPENTSTHSPDQIIVFYSPGNYLQTDEKTGKHFRPTDDILFSGDLWLMMGPLFNEGFGNFFRRLRFRLSWLKNRLKSWMSGKGTPRRDPRDEDSKAKEALKAGFVLIMVKPGHREEFVGSRIIPRSLLADRDLLVVLGYSLNADKAILGGRDIAPKVAALREQAYASFVKEVLFWRELGYTPDEVSQLLVRIYKEQSGGNPLVKEDRRQRRERLKETLSRLKDDKAESEELHQLAQSTLLELERVLSP